MGIAGYIGWEGLSMNYKSQADWLLTVAEDYSDQDYIKGDLQNAAKSITTLLTRAEEAEAMIETLKNERDAAVSDLRKLVPAWKWDGKKLCEKTPKCGCVEFG